ncbi:hypothetical protein CRG98_005856 [Punica granatum]|uniref:Large ribosomal subunit protein bL20c n=1 Tax=Punica granatum TaxID=22663 RepID=A0A2I0KZ74_PUNGR|nr:hypothetical protein CRG98_005856 [Punica granatum]
MKENIQLNWKVLSELSMHEPLSFKALVDISRNAFLGNKNVVHPPRKLWSLVTTDGVGDPSKGWVVGIKAPNFRDYVRGLSILGRVAAPATRSGASIGASAPAQAVNIIVTDECPRGYCSKRWVHFDLSGAAFGRMAISSEGG